MRKINTDSEIT